MRTRQLEHLAKNQVVRSSVRIHARKYLNKMVGERGFEPPTPWSRTRSKRLLKSVEICCLQLIDTGPVASRSLKAVAIGRNERFSLSQICLHHVRIFKSSEKNFCQASYTPS